MCRAGTGDPHGTTKLKPSHMYPHRRPHEARLLELLLLEHRGRRLRACGLLQRYRASIPADRARRGDSRGRGQQYRQIGTHGAARVTNGVPRGAREFLRKSHRDFRVDRLARQIWDSIRGNPTAMSSRHEIAPAPRPADEPTVRRRGEEPFRVRRARTRRQRPADLVDKSALRTDMRSRLALAAILLPRSIPNGLPPLVITGGWSSGAWCRACPRTQGATRQ